MSRSFDFDSADVLSIGDVAAADITGTAFTASAWVRHNVGTTGGSAIAKSSSAATDAYNFGVFTAGTVAYCDISDSGGADNVTGVTAVPANAWHHIAVVKQGTGSAALRVYLDGVLDASATSNRSIQNAAAALTLGRRASADSAFNGDLAECALWNASLSDMEIAALGKGVSAMQVRAGNLRGYWPLWGVASPERDLSVNRNHATVTGTIPAGNTHPPVSFVVRPTIYITPLRSPISTDAATVEFVFTPTGAEVVSISEFGTVPLDLVASGADVYEHATYSDAATILLDLQPVGGECFSAFHFTGEGEASQKWVATATDRWSTDDNQRWSAVFAGQEVHC